jgi:ubiquitin carboxyl-terminal hydrolase 8
MTSYDNYKNKGLSGLINMGNTCWLNSATQVLSNTLPLTSYFLENTYKEDINVSKKEYKFLREWIKLLDGLWSENCIIKPVSYHKHFHHFYDGGLFDQEDAEEGLTKILDLLHESVSYDVDINFNGTPKNITDKLMIKSIKSWSNNFKNGYSKIIDIFYGQYLSEVKCLSCNYTSHTFDPFTIIQLSITDKTDSLDNCLQQFISTEKLEAESEWKCEKCKTKNGSEKKILLWKAPNILMIQFKRFNFYQNVKINNFINFPLDELDLNLYINGYDKNDAIYELYGVIEHIGYLNGGHYISHVKNMNNKWYTYDDQTVSEIDRDKLRKKQAYILVYQKK